MSWLELLTIRAEQLLLLILLTSQAEPTRLANKPDRAKPSWAELARRLKMHFLGEGDDITHP
jgi:hypothetical protein